MKFSVVDVFAPALIALLFWRAKPVKPFCGLFYDGYISRETGKALRGFFALVIILHHLAFAFSAGILTGWLQIAGIPSVSVFFFLSGYGLMMSYRKNPAYKDRFLMQRIPKVLVPYLVVTALFWLFDAINGDRYSAKALILASLNGKPVVHYSWYIICILLFYVFFWVLMCLCKKRYFMMVLGACCWYAAYMVFCIKMNYETYWYRTALFLIVGMIWALYEDKLSGCLKRYYRILAPVSWITFLTLLICFQRLTASLDSAVVRGIIVFFYAASFLLTVLTVTLKFRLGNPVLTFLGENSLEIYLVQGLFIAGLRSGLLYIRNDFLWALLCMIGSVVLGSLLHVVTKKLFRKPQTAPK